MRVSDVLGDIEKEHWHKMGYNDLTEVMVAFPRHWKHAHTHKNLQCFCNTVLRVKCAPQVFDNIRQKYCYIFLHLKTRKCSNLGALHL